MTTRDPERPAAPTPEPSAVSSAKSSTPPPIPRAAPFFPLSNENNVQRLARRATARAATLTCCDDSSADRRGN